MCAGVTETLLDKVTAGGYVPVDLDVASLANLLLRSTFWQGESMFHLAKKSEDQALPADQVRQTYGQARGVYQQVLTRGTKLRDNFPDTTQNLYSIMGGEKLDIPIVGEAQYMIGQCLYKEGDLNGAKDRIQSITSPERLKMKADYLLAAIAYDQGDLNAAKAMAESWLNNDFAQDMSDEYNVGAQVLLAKVALASGNIAEAKAQALDTWALYKTISGLWEESAYVVAKCYQQENDIEKARTWYERLQDSYLERWRVISRGAILQLPQQ
jgi:tetratricopeptide (TPR) repeat protein